MESSTSCEFLSALVGSVMRRYARRWLRFIHGILKNEADAEDVIQEAVRRVLARNVTIRSEEEARRYLGRAIANAALELYNRRRRERARAAVIDEQTLSSTNISSPFVLMMEDEKSGERERQLLLLDEGLKGLPEKQYEALRITILDANGLSMRDVGAVHGIPYSTLRHRSKQGLKQLRSFLKARGRKQVERLNVKR